MSDSAYGLAASDVARDALREAGAVLTKAREVRAAVMTSERLVSARAAEVADTAAGIGEAVASAGAQAVAALLIGSLPERDTFRKLSDELDIARAEIARLTPPSFDFTQPRNAVLGFLLLGV